MTYAPQSLLVQPIPPPNLDAIMAWFSALDGTDLRNGVLGLAVVAIVGLLLVLGTMAVVRLVR